MNTNNQNPQGAATNQADHLVNRDFARLVKQLRRILPYLAIALLAIVYTVSGVSEGLFLSDLMKKIPLHLPLALAIGGSTQLTRMLLVFFPQLNPNKPVTGYTGEIVAILMGVISIVSITKLVLANEMSIAVATSLSILMAAGVGVEIYLLKEIRFYTDMELFRNKGWWSDLQEFMVAQRDFKIMKDNLRDGQTGTAPGVRKLNPPAAQNQPGANAPQPGAGAPLPDSTPQPGVNAPNPPAANTPQPGTGAPQPNPTPQPGVNAPNPPAATPPASTPDPNEQMTPEEQAEYDRLISGYQNMNAQKATKLRKLLDDFDNGTASAPLSTPEGNGSGVRQLEFSINGHSKNGHGS
jgi:hypothetical protein